MLEEIKKDLEKEYDEIYDYGEDCEKKQKVLQANTNSEKFLKTGIISAFSIIPSLIASISMIASISTGLALPTTLAMGISLASSIGIGYVGQSIITAFSKRKMKKFTNTQKNADILQEMMHYEMEIDKVENKKEVLRKMYEAIESKQQILSDYSGEFYQIDKYEKLNSEDLKNRQEMLTKAYKERLEQLDILSSQKYLKNKFRYYRKKVYRIENIITSALMLSLPFCLIVGIPLSLELTRNVTLATMADFGKILSLAFTPTLVVTPLSLPYFIKRDKDFMNAFNNLNKSLGENALSEKPNAEYENELKNMISIKIGEIVELGMELKEISYAIEKRNIETTIESDEKSKENTWENVRYTEEEIRHYIPESPAPFNPETIFGANDTVLEQHPHQAILDNLGKNSVENIINDPTPFPDQVYRPNPNTIGEETEGPKLVKRRIPPR